MDTKFDSPPPEPCSPLSPADTGSLREHAGWDEDGWGGEARLECSCFLTISRPAHSTAPTRQPRSSGGVRGDTCSGCVHTTLFYRTQRLKELPPCGEALLGFNWCLTCLGAPLCSIAPRHGALFCLRPRTRKQRALEALNAAATPFSFSRAPRPAAGCSIERLLAHIPGPNQRCHLNCSLFFCHNSPKAPAHATKERGLLSERRMALIG